MTQQENCKKSAKDRDYSFITYFFFTPMTFIKHTIAITTIITSIYIHNESYKYTCTEKSLSYMLNY